MVDIDLIDTNKLKDSGNDILENVKLYKEVIDSYFDKINNMTSNTFEWIGNKANDYVEQVNNDYKFYYDIYDILLSYGQYLIDTGENIESIMKGLK